MRSEEQRRLAQWQDAQRRLADQLRLLSELAAARGDTETVARLAPLLADADRIANQEPTLDSYLEASLANDTQQGEWDALSPELEESYGGEWQTADSIMEELSVESDVGFVRAANLGKIASYLDQKGEIVEHAIVKDDIDTPSPAKPSKTAASTPETDREKEAALARERKAAEDPASAGSQVSPLSLPPWHFGSLLTARRFRLFLGAEAPAAFRFWSSHQLAEPVAYWLQLAASRPADRHGR